MLLTLDGSVDGAEVSVIFPHWNGVGGTWAVGDVNSDNLIDGTDLAIVYSNWTGDASPPRATVTTPLPAARSATVPQTAVRSRTQRIDAAMQDLQPEEWQSMEIYNTIAKRRGRSVGKPRS